MNEYRVKGLSCSNCAAELERQIKKLEHGGSAVLSYNSGKLKLDPQISLEAVERILRSDGASLARPEAAESHTSPPPAEQRHKGSAAAAAPDGGMQSRVRLHSGADAHRHAQGDDRHGSIAYGGADTHDAHGHAYGADDAQGHSHADGHGRTVLTLLIVSAILYGTALLLDGTLPKPALIAIYIVAAGLSGYSTFARGVKNLLRFRFNIDTLMTIALVGAAAIGEWKEASLVAILFGLNELLEGYGMETTRRSMESLLNTAPSTAIRLQDGREAVIPVRQLQIGDIVIIKPGSKIPSDGVIEQGASSVNEAAITGESLPVDKQAGDRVFGGSVNNEGALRVRIEKAYEDSSLARILHLVEEAQDTKTPTELFINRFAQYYTPFIMLVAALVMVIPPLFIGKPWHDWLYQGLSVLIVGCPCALILSSPIAIVSGIARNARNGILVKGGVYLEQLGHVDIMAFDKTGTLTKGEPHVVATTMYNAELFYRVAGAIERTSSHPLAKAVMKELDRLQMDYPAAEQVTALPGSGMKAVVEGAEYWIGNEAVIRSLGIAIPEPQQSCAAEWKSQGLTLVLAASKTELLGMFGIADEIRSESRAMMASLHRSGIKRTVMLTGDHGVTAANVADAVGVTEYYAGLLPDEKAAKIRELSAQGRVAMIGDGINDAPALASASLGIAMGKGTDSAIETADIVLMQDHIGKLPAAISLSKRVNWLIRFNLSVALGLKLIALLLTIPGWLTLWIAILSDMGATVFVTLASLTILLSPKARREAKIDI
ncbi:heavy metal translocating P-type ATPase [Paenibacillus protaetiae]|uniref:Cd(2+)-exporting ATPase n=1 Tax=Paenibacillus protaetiae TaxID=2509456 RepID=A0A4P6ETG1_9BACL|nr:heavy metal translocating P-type ATPase [Paenibacillus protaetiae]QAY65725.1 cadmium-translocating P-type ATPase [Paenibacillus protaetiae]